MMKKLARKMLAVTAAIIISIGQPLSVSATSEYPGHDYPSRLPEINIPGVTVNRVDFRNNQVEMVVNPLTMTRKTIKSIGMGWVKEHSESIDSMDLLSYGTVNVGWVQRVFDMDYDTFKTYKAKQLGVYEVYIVDPDDGVDLKMNTGRRMFFIIDFTDGTKWIDRLTYTSCAIVSEKSCNVRSYQYENEYDVLKYALADAPEKFIRTLPEEELGEAPGQESGEEQGRENGSDDEIEQEPIGDEENNETGNKTGNEVDENDEVGNETDEETKQEGSELGSEQGNTVTIASMPETIDTINTVNRNINNMGDDSIDLDEVDDSTEEIIEEFDESFDGPGDTTLEIPTLGDITSNSCGDFNWIPIFISGAVVGTSLTLFLFSIIRYIKEAKRNL